MPQTRLTVLSILVSGRIRTDSLSLLANSTLDGLTTQVVHLVRLLFLPELFTAIANSVVEFYEA